MKKTFARSISKMPIYLLVIIIIGLCFSSCSLHFEKRKYRKGYYIETSKNRNQDKSTNTTQHIRVNKYSNEEVIIIPTKQSIHVIDTINNISPIIHLTQKTNFTKNEIPKKPQKAFISKITKKSECDILHLMDGTTLEISVIQINDKEVAYKKCNFLDGPTYKTSILKVKDIELKNGEVYKPDPKTIKQQKENNHAEVSGGMVAGMIIAGIATLALLAGIIVVLATAGFTAFFATIPLAIAGILSLISLILSAKYLKKGAHPLGKGAFALSLIVQILAIIFTVLMFFI